jgi:hypothetical protein
MISDFPTIVGFEVSKVMGNDEVKALLSALPEKHIVNPPLLSVRYEDKVVLEIPGHRKYPVQNVLGNCVIKDNQKVADVILYRQQESGNLDPYIFKVSLLHEIGHVAFEFNLTDKLKKQWYGIQAHNCVVWNPACRDPLEQFCDTFAHYHLSDNVVQSIFPTEHAFFAKYVFCKEANND